MNSNMTHKHYQQPVARMVPLDLSGIVCTSGSEGQIPSFDEKIVYTEDF